ncbi:MAG: OprO/OprP family phosphate-selective porin [Wenzhouxiangellaceae bacterium]
MLNNKPVLGMMLAAGLATVAVDAMAQFQMEINPRGRFHLDFAVHDEDERELGDKFRVRRARLGLSGKVAEDWRFQVEYDFAENSTQARDVYLRYTGFSYGDITIGHFKVPFGLEELISSNNISNIERSLPVTTFAQSRRVGVGWSNSGEQWGASVMGFGQGSGSAVRSDDSADEGLGIGGRFYYNPVIDSNTVIHLGIAGTWEEPENSQLDQVRLRTRPESRPTGARLIDTGNIGNVSSIAQLGLEAAWRSGPWSLQGEWMRSDISRKSGSPDVDFSGWYVSGSWVLTGESRGYRDGVFRGVSPSGAGGAWEVTARLSYVDLDDGPIFGGDQRNVTVGLNWYANSRVRFMSNLIFVDSERQGVDDDPLIFLMRAQVSF